MVKFFFSLFIAFSLSIAAVGPSIGQAQVRSTEDEISNEPVPESSLVDLVSPDELAEELQLPPVESAEEEATVLSPMTQAMDRDFDTTIDVTQYFPVVILVNKAASGPTAQTMKVFHRGVLKYVFKVSTGRETPENAKSGRQYFSSTSVGWYAPTRTYDKYYSNTWLAWMNNSIFFNGGLALHATTPDHYKELGRRASGGCVRLHAKDAKVVYDLVLGEGKGRVPAYTVQGRIQTTAFGQIKFREHWNTLIVIQDNPLN